MRGYVLDTNAVSDLMNGNPVFEARFLSCVDPVITSIVVRGEIEFGIARLPAGRRQAILELSAIDVFDTVFCQPATELMALEYAKTKLAVQLSGFSMSDNDLWIAATAIAFGATLVTRDLDFRRIPGLLVEDWTQP